MLFDLMDANKDGVLQEAEFQFGLTQHDFVSGPGSPYSQLFGFMEGEMTRSSIHNVLNKTKASENNWDLHPGRVASDFQTLASKF